MLASGKDTTISGTESVASKGLIGGADGGGGLSVDAVARRAEGGGGGTDDIGNGSRAEGGTLPEGGRENKGDGEIGDGSRAVVGALLEGGRDCPLPSTDGLLDPSPLPGSKFRWD